MIKPIKSFLLLLLIGIFLIPLMFFLPEEWRINDQFKLRFFTFKSVFSERPEYAEIPDVPQVQDTLAMVKDTTEIPAMPPFEGEGIQYKTKGSLVSFFKSLSQLENDQKNHFRILHYGDSQLEGDRITSVLRNKFQNDFGGGGPGINSASNALNSKITVFQRNDPRWKKYSFYGKNRGASNYYGIMGDYYTYGPIASKPTELKDSLVHDTLPAIKIAQKYRANITYTKSQYVDTSGQSVQNVKLLYRNPSAPFHLSVISGKDTLRHTPIPASEYFNIYTVPVPYFHQIQLHFGSEFSPQIYGVALDTYRGIGVDNIPMRGSATPGFTSNNAAHLARQLRQLNVQLLILQYGVNVVPGELKNYDYYQKMMSRELALIKKIMPDMSILVVGVSDMSKKQGGYYVSYPNIEKIRDAQKQAALENGCAFWDLFEAMGGKNSMPSWVRAKPALANTDYTHFTLQGANRVAEMLYNALMYEYEVYKHYQ